MCADPSRGKPVLTLFRERYEVLATVGSGGEAQIVKALAHGHDTPERIVSVLYQGLPQAVRAAAVESVLAHLIKLQVEGRARQDGDRWTPQAG